MSSKWSLPALLILSRHKNSSKRLHDDTNYIPFKDNHLTFPAQKHRCEGVDVWWQTDGPQYHSGLPTAWSGAALKKNQVEWFQAQLIHNLQQNSKFDHVNIYLSNWPSSGSIPNNRHIRSARISRNFLQGTYCIQCGSFGPAPTLKLLPNFMPGDQVLRSDMPKDVHWWPTSASMS